MKYLKECAVILGITLAGEWLNFVLPLPGSRRGVRVVFDAFIVLHGAFEAGAGGREVPFRHYACFVCSGGSGADGKLWAA